MRGEQQTNEKFAIKERPVLPPFSIEGKRCELSLPLAEEPWQRSFMKSKLKRQ